MAMTRMKSNGGTLRRAATCVRASVVIARIRGQNTGRDLSLPGAGPCPGGRRGPLAAATAITASQVDQGGGWLYHLLAKLGVSPDTASTVTDLIIRPLEHPRRRGRGAHRGALRRQGDPPLPRAGGQPDGRPLGLASGPAARVTTMSGVVANVWRFFVFVVAGAIVLGMLGINLTPLLASATIIGATLGFGAQQIVRDYFSGILMTMEDQYNVGDSVMVGGVTGVVEDVTMRAHPLPRCRRHHLHHPQRGHPPARQPLAGLGPRRRRPDAARCVRRRPRHGAADHRGGGARGRRPARSSPPTAPSPRTSSASSARTPRPSRSA